MNHHIQAIADDVVLSDREARQRNRIDYRRLAVWMAIAVYLCAAWGLAIGCVSR